MKTKFDIFFDPESHIYLVDGVEVPSVTEILSPLHRSYDNINPSVLEYAANRGKAVHEACELIDYGEEPEIDPEIEGYITAYLDFLNIYRPTWTGVERIVYSSTHGYIGTLDRIGWLSESEFAVVDIKTSQPTKDALVSVCLQTMAYSIAFEDEAGVPCGITRYGLFLKPDGTFRFLDCNEYQAKYKFNASEAWMNLLNTNKMVTKLLEGKGF